MVHCSGGAQTKVLHFIENLHVIKDNLFPVPPLFSLIQDNPARHGKKSTRYLTWDTVWSCMYRKLLLQTSSHLQSFHIDAQIVGRVEAAEQKQVTVKAPAGTSSIHDHSNIL